MVRAPRRRRPTRTRPTSASSPPGGRPRRTGIACPGRRGSAPGILEAAITIETVETPLRIGILALQGNVREHAAMLRRLGVEPVEVRLPEELDGLDGLVIPGGE